MSDSPQPYRVLARKYRPQSFEELIGQEAMVKTLANAIARDLTFEDRVKAQEAIERVYYSHQIGTTTPFEKAVTHELLERKVRTYLKQTVALEMVWQTTVTSEALQHELRRIVRSTRSPGRLEEVFEALGHDPGVFCETGPGEPSREELLRNGRENSRSREEQGRGASQESAAESTPDTRAWS